MVSELSLQGPGFVGNSQVNIHFTWKVNGRNLQFNFQTPLRIGWQYNLQPIRSQVRKFLLTNIYLRNTAKLKQIIWKTNNRSKRHNLLSNGIITQWLWEKSPLTWFINCFVIYIIISKNIRYLLWNQGFWRSLNNTYPIFLTPCIRCTNHLCDSCDLTDRKSTFYPVTYSEWFKMLTYYDVIDTWAGRQQLWRQNERLFPCGCYGRFLNTMMLRTVI